ncbi:MAG TPA: hypothetical protein VM370_02195 [Candidatus Thermoplasmatota archaeon]|nr:hypothetical protein [Candidatus Thermoplasmatota archaeon]
MPTQRAAGGLRGMGPFASESLLWLVLMMALGLGLAVFLALR